LENIETLVISKWKFKNDEDVDRCVNCVKDIVTDDKDLSNLFFNFSFNDSENCSLDTAIFNALIDFNKKKSITDKIEITIDWNRFDIAQKKLFNDKIDWVSLFLFVFPKLIFLIPKLKQENDFTTPYELMEIIIKENKHQFLNLFMDHGIHMQLNKSMITDLLKTV
jgi:hypothetical protein